jgi:hypothetical protein
MDRDILQIDRIREIYGQIVGPKILWNDRRDVMDRKDVDVLDIYSHR